MAETYILLTIPPHPLIWLHHHFPTSWNILMECWYFKQKLLRKYSSVPPGPEDPQCTHAYHEHYWATSWAVLRKFTEVGSARDVIFPLCFWVSRCGHSLGGFMIHFLLIILTLYCSQQPPDMNKEDFKLECFLHPCVISVFPSTWWQCACCFC